MGQSYKVPVWRSSQFSGITDPGAEPRDGKETPWAASKIELMSGPHPRLVQIQRSLIILNYACFLVIKELDFTNWGPKEQSTAGWILLRNYLEGSWALRDHLSKDSEHWKWGRFPNREVRFHLREKEEKGRHSGEPSPRPEGRHPFPSVRTSQELICEGNFDIWPQMWVEDTVCVLRFFLWRIS